MFLTMVANTSYQLALGRMLLETRFHAYRGWIGGEINRAKHSCEDVNLTLSPTPITSMSTKVSCASDRE